MKTNRTRKVAVGNVKKSTGHQILHMAIEKAPRGLGRWLATANHVLGDGGLGNG